MCSPTTCHQCGKVTWSGCGQHVDSVRAMVPADQWCDGHEAPVVSVSSRLDGAVDGAADGAPRDLTAADFEAIIADNEIVLVDFWAAWCGPCRMFAPIFEKAAAAHPDIVFGKVDTEAEQALAAAARISSIPTLMAFKKGTLVFSQPGALPAPSLEELISAVRALDVDKALAEATAAQAG